MGLSLWRQPPQSSGNPAFLGRRGVNKTLIWFVPTRLTGHFPAALLLKEPCDAAAGPLTSVVLVRSWIEPSWVDDF